MLRELLAALDAMPEKRLIARELHADGDFCALGVVGAARGIDMEKLDPEDWEAVAEAFGIAPCMVREIVFENDESIDEFDWIDVELVGPVRPHHPDFGRNIRTVRVPAQRAEERRWRHMREWVASQIARTEQTPDE